MNGLAQGLTERKFALICAHLRSFKANFALICAPDPRKMLSANKRKILRSFVLILRSICALSANERKIFKMTKWAQI